MRYFTVLAVLVCGALMAVTDSKWVTHNKRTTDTCSCDCSTTLAAACAANEGFSLYTDEDGAEVCIMVPDTEKKHNAAKTDCESYTDTDALYTGRLFKSDTIAKMNLLRDYSNKTNIWVGLDDKTSEGKFVWSDGIQMSDAEKSGEASLFKEGEPNAGSSSVDCVEWNRNEPTDMALNDRKCDANRGYACEIHDATVTEKRAVKRTIESCACSCGAIARCAANGEGYTLVPDDAGIESCLSPLAVECATLVGYTLVTNATGYESCLSALAVECAALEGYTLVTDDAGIESCLSPFAVECATIAGYTLVSDDAGIESCLSPLGLTCSENEGFTLFTDGNGTEVCLKVSGDNDAKRAVKSTEDDKDTKRAVRTLLKMLKQYV